MARLSRIKANRELQVLENIKFERSPVWTEILGKIALQARTAGEEIEPESEFILQRLIELYPGILPWSEFKESSEQEEILFCVVCEGVSSAATDILLVESTTTGGRFVVVETKLIKNPEIHRSVVGQILEYAAWLCSNERLEDLEAIATDYWKKRGGRFKGDFPDEMKKAFGESWRQAIWQTAFDNLRKGNVRLVIVSDTLPEDLRHTVSFLPSNVLLSAVEIQPCGSPGDDEKLLITGAKSSEAIGAEALRSAMEKYFSGISLSYLQVQSLAGRYIAAEAIGGNRTSAYVPHPTFEEYLKGLGGEERMPGKALAAFRAQVLTTHGWVNEGKESLTLRFWGLPGLMAYDDDDGQLCLILWLDTPLGPRRQDEVRTIFLKHFPDHREIVQRETPSGIYFRPITRSSRGNDVKRLVKRLSSLYEELHKLKTKG